MIHPRHLVSIACLFALAGCSLLAAPSSPLDAPAPIRDAVGLRALETPLDHLSYDRTPLSAVFSDLQTKTGVNLIVEWDVLRQQEVSDHFPITLSASKVTIVEALELMNRQVQSQYPLAELGCYVLGDNIVITTGEVAARRVLTHVYDVSDLLPSIPASTNPAPPPGKIVPDLATTTSASQPSGKVLDPPMALMTAIANSVDTSMWSCIQDLTGNTAWERAGASATGSLSYFNGKMIVSTTVTTHRKVAALLEELRANKTGAH